MSVAGDSVRIDIPLGDDPVPVADEEDWRFLTQEDVKDLQTLFDYFVRQDPEGMRASTTARRSITNSAAGAAAAAGKGAAAVGAGNGQDSFNSDRKDGAGSLWDDSETSRLGGLDSGMDSRIGLDSERSTASGFGVPGAAPGRVHPALRAEAEQEQQRRQKEQGQGGKTELRISARGVTKLLESVGLMLPLREVEGMLAARKAALLAGTPIDDISGSATSGSSSSAAAALASPVPSGASGGAGAGAAGEGGSESSFTYEEFLILYAECSKRLSSERELKEAFRVLDDDMDGFVSVPKLVPVVQQMVGLSQVQAQALLAQSYVDSGASTQAAVTLGARHNADEHGRPFPVDRWLLEGQLSFADFVYFMQC